MLLRTIYQLSNGNGKPLLINSMLPKLENKALIEPQLLPLLKDHFLTTTLTMEPAQLEVALTSSMEEMLLLTDHHSEDVMLELIQLFQEHQKSSQLQVQVTVLPQVTKSFMDHAQMSPNALLEISFNIMVILLMELLMLLESKEYYSADYIDFIIYFFN